MLNPFKASGSLPTRSLYARSGNACISSIYDRKFSSVKLQYANQASDLCLPRHISLHVVFFLSAINDGFLRIGEEDGVEAREASGKG